MWHGMVTHMEGLGWSRFGFGILHMVPDPAAAAEPKRIQTGRRQPWIMQASSAQDAHGDGGYLIKRDSADTIPGFRKNQRATAIAAGMTGWS